MEGESGELCGVPGSEDETITKGEFNRLVSQVKWYHLRPIKQSLERQEKSLLESTKIMQSHIDADREFHAKLSGAKWALYAIAGCLAPTIPIIYYLVKALTEAGIL